MLGLIAFVAALVVLDRLGYGALTTYAGSFAVGTAVEYGVSRVSRLGRTNSSEATAEQSRARSSEGMAARFGDVLYWAATLIALAVASLTTYAAMFGTGKGPAPFIQGFMVVAAGAIWLFGRACRYVLAGR